MKFPIFVNDKLTMSPRLLWCSFLNLPALGNHMTSAGPKYFASARSGDVWE